MHRWDSEGFRYYEKFQVEDVMVMFSRQIALARTPDGAQVFLQEIKVRRSLPPGIVEMLSNLQHPYVAPILEVLMEGDRIVLVHPPLEGDPLSLVVNEENPMNAYDALNVFRKLLRTQVELANLPLPLTTVLDPKNIIMNGNQPYVLFLDFKSSQREDEKWRGLLYFLLTGVQPKESLYRMPLRKGSSAIPPELEQLVVECFNPERSIRQILRMAEQIVLERPKENKTKRIQRVAIYSAAAAACLVLGAFMGKQAAGDSMMVKNLSSSTETEFLADTTKIEFKSSMPEVYALKDKVVNETRISGVFSQQVAGPFSIYLESEEQRSYGVQINEEGKIVLFEISGGRYQTVENPYHQVAIRPGKSYIFEMRYTPEEPLRIAIRDSEEMVYNWATGTIPHDPPFHIKVLGGRGTVLNDLNIYMEDAENGTS